MESIYTFFNHLPNWSKVFFAFTVVPIYIFKDALSDLIKKTNVKSLFLYNKLDEKKMENLLYHDFFISLSEVSAKVEKIDFSKENELNNFKRKMMIHLIKFKTISIEKHFKKILKDKEINSISSQEFKFKVIGSINILIAEYNKQAIDLFVNMGVSVEDPEFFVNSYELYRKTIIDSFVNRLESITISKQYHNNYERMLAMFEVLTVAVEVIPRDVESLYFIINGRYDKYNKKLINLNI